MFIGARTERKGHDTHSSVLVETPGIRVDGRKADRRAQCAAAAAAVAVVVVGRRNVARRIGRQSRAQQKDATTRTRVRPAQLAQHAANVAALTRTIKFFLASRARCHAP